MADILLPKSVLQSLPEINRTPVACRYNHMLHSRGYWFGDDPFRYNGPVFIAEIAFVFIVTRAIHLVLRPLHQTMIISQIIAGIVIGPSVLGVNEFYNKKLFPLAVRHMLRTFAEFGLMLHLFLLGLQIDVSLLRQLSKRAMIIGFSSTMVPFTLGMASYVIIHYKYPFDEDIRGGIPLMIGLTSVTSFVVVSNLLSDLKMLNSELGRLASSISMVSDAIGWIFIIIARSYDDTRHLSTTRPITIVLSFMSYYCAMFFLLRPLIIWIGDQTPEGKSMKESHFVTIMCTVMGVGLIGEIIGQHGILGCFFFGLCLPDGPPLGTQLVNKLEVMASGVLLPIFCAMTGFRLDLDTFGNTGTLRLELLLIIGYLGKFIGTILASLCFDISFFQSLTLACVISCRGVMEMTHICKWRDKRFLTSLQVSLLIVNLIIVTMICTPAVVYLYDPSRRYMCYTRRTILKSKQNHLRILVCIHEEENVSPLINLLEVSSPSRSSPSTAFVLQLLELKGSVSAFLKPQNQPIISSVASSTPIMNAFNQFERRCNGNVVVQHFTTIAPYATMHDDICTLALDKRTNIVIVPFHKTWDLGLTQSSNPSIRAVNRNVLDKAPCSVGILVDRGKMGSGNRPLPITQAFCKIVMLFIGGHDDREAVAYSRRMAEHPNVSLTVIWLIHINDSNTTIKNDVDKEVIDEMIRPDVVGKKITYREENVKDGIGTVEVIQNLKDSFDLYVVGKNHDADAAATLGLNEWNEFPELGIIGDMLLNSDDTFSVLVVQQQPVVEIRH